jgi:protein TonB
MAYQNADTPDRLKAIGGVLVVHAALAALILSGLGVTRVAHTVERLKTFEILQPPSRPPPPRSAAQRARDREGAAARKALATPIVAPRIQLPAKPPVIAAAVPSTGSAATAGAASDGNGTGAGGSGNGLGGGGSGDYSGYTPAQIINKIPDREYRRLSNGRIPWGSASIRFRVNPNGTMANCRITRSSGDPSVDWTVCDVATRYLRFDPARNRDGQPIAQDMSYTPIWRPNY